MNSNRSPQPGELPGPFTIPAAWRGAELLQRDDWLIELTAGHIGEIEAALSSAEASGRPVEQGTIAEFPLPELGQLLSRVQDQLEHGSGGCMIRGLPVKKFSEEQLRRIFWGIALHLGTPVSQSAAGERIFSVRDEGFKVGQPQARGPNTKKRLSFHTDRCDVIGFLCLQPAAQGGDNQLVSSVTLYNVIREKRPDLARVLMQPFYYARHNVDQGNELPYCRQPIFAFHEGYFAAAYLRVLIDRAYALPELPDMTDEQHEALAYLEETAADPQLHVTFRQQAGDLLFLNNWVTFHRRDEFQDAEELELRRHLLRIWLAVPNSRPLDPLFEANYGATAAGAIRGGMKPKG
ncbi:Taurine catabolism dioxygenase TauD, TfdA family [Symmachiella dynata]|uniref:Taurine catabolism dioxygenase TauD, TfdA family n=1 Tax=Symmachiella dynata TaxID=2527995 RepID=A0A517ZMR9_9PLAN|nr:TauD/TfdA family dioxygenase [Symmachiella dynata]QDU43783.1 Taurine catabolism dioxygenase TauD, TfdA family [Symmachiella dynata]